MDRLSYSFILGYHGCDREVGERLLEGVPFRTSENEYDWLGHGIYFWEANPSRGLEFAKEAKKRNPRKLKTPYVVGAVIDLGDCLDLSTSKGVAAARQAYESLKRLYNVLEEPLPTNSNDRLKRPLDCNVIEHAHNIYESLGKRFDSVRGIFTEGVPAYDGAGFDAKTHVQIAVRTLECIKGVFRVPDRYLEV
ncbi:MAG: hypothetical protein OEL53_09590 [Rhodospirillales bacterium]|nr:hypothetical protein [Rhodospirillales bacterium]